MEWCGHMICLVVIGVVPETTHQSTATTSELALAAKFKHRHQEHQQ
jgi:hypothetical protein